MRTVAVLNQKGGVGKTTVTLGLAAAAAHAQRRVLVIDLDPQGSTSWVLAADPHTVYDDDGNEQVIGPPSVGDVLSGAALAEAIQPSTWGEHVDVIVAGPALQRFEALPKGGLQLVAVADRIQIAQQRMQLEGQLTAGTSQVGLGENHGFVRQADSFGEQSPCAREL